MCYVKKNITQKTETTSNLRGNTEYYNNAVYCVISILLHCWSHTKFLISLTKQEIEGFG